jgi:hypothetical protein
MIRSNVVTKHTVVLVNKKKYMESKYWSNKGKYSKEIDELYNTEIIPLTGETDSSALEVIRLVNKIGYEIYNNGGINMLDDREKTGIDNYYQEIFDDLIRHSSKIGLGSLARELVTTIKESVYFKRYDDEYPVAIQDENLADDVGEILDELLDKAYEYYVSHEK